MTTPGDEDQQDGEFSFLFFKLESTNDYLYRLPRCHPTTRHPTLPFNAMTL